MNAAADRAIASRRIKHGGDGVFSLAPVVDHRHDDAVRAVVENALDVVMAIGWHSRQGDAAGVGDRRKHVRGRLPVHQAVLEIDRQPLEPGAGQEPGGNDASQRQPRSHRGPAFFERFLDRVGTHALLQFSH